MNPSIIITGFNPYGRVAENPSERLVVELARRRGEEPVCTVLDTSYRVATKQIHELIAMYQAVPVLMFGHSQRAHGLRLERFAQNRDRSGQPDNFGAVASGSAIVPGAQPLLRSTIDIDAVAELLGRADVPVQMSDDAGGYVCNHVYFHTLHLLGSSAHPGTPCVFVHLPTPADGIEWQVFLRGAEILINFMKGYATR